MTGAVVVGAVVVGALNAIPALFGGWCWHRGEANKAFWVLLRVGQAGALLYAAAVGLLAATGRYSSEHIFYLYALLPLAIAFVAEQLRITSAQAVLDRRDLESAQAVGRLPDAEQRLVVAEILRREMGVMALAAIVVVFLAWRAAETAHGF
jgi:hypothetical protein